MLRNAQFVFGMSQRPKKQILDDASAVRALRERLEAMRDAAARLSRTQRDAGKVPWSDLDAIDTGTEAVWNAAKRATPKIIAALTPLVRDDPEAAFFLAPVRTGRAAKTDEEAQPREAPKPEPPDRALNGNEIAELELRRQERSNVEESFYSWLRRDRTLAPAEWRKRRAAVEKARREEDRYVEKLFKSRAPGQSGKT